MESLQAEARALGDPTRHRVFRYLLASPRPVGVAELTEHCGLHHNAIRVHLAKLVAAGLVRESVEAPRGRGRPRLLYAVDPAAQGRWGDVGPYERLSVMLAEVVRTGDAPEDVGRRSATGVSAGDVGPVEAFAAEMARHGFDPEVHVDGVEVQVTLRACPFASAVLADPGTVCGLHLGLALGVAEAVGGLEVEDLLPRDPRRANCRLRCRLTRPEATPPGR